MRDGTYRHRVEIEGIDGSMTLACAVKIAGETIRIDFAGTGPSVRRGINVPFCYTRAMSLYTIKCITAPSLPNNEGATAPITVVAPPGSILNALPPSPTGGRHAIGHFVTPLVFGALAQAAPDAVQADCGMMDLVTFHGTHPDGRPDCHHLLRRRGLRSTLGLRRGQRHARAIEHGGGAGRGVGNANGDDDRVEAPPA